MADIRINTTVNRAKLEKAARFLYDNGIEGDECGVVLQALGYVLLDAELDCDDIEFKEEEDEEDN